MIYNVTHVNDRSPWENTGLAEERERVAGTGRSRGILYSTNGRQCESCAARLVYHVRVSLTERPQRLLFRLTCRNGAAVFANKTCMIHETERLSAIQDRILLHFTRGTCGSETVSILCNQPGTNMNASFPDFPSRPAILSASSSVPAPWMTKSQWTLTSPSNQPARPALSQQAPH